MVKTAENKNTAKYQDVVSMTQKYLEKFISFPDKSYAFACALWVVMTHVWPSFDTVPYLVVTSYTKRSGKTTLMECISAASANSLFAGGITASMLWQKIQEEHPTVFMDEAEKLTSETANDMRSALNTGYRRGQKWINNNGEFDLYAPKAFSLIGDVNDTLRDRSIVITMRRSEAPLRSTYTQRMADGAIVREKISMVVEEAKLDLIDNFTNWKGADFLNDRDEEIWSILFALVATFCPQRSDEMKRTAVDIATEKTQDMRSFVELRKGEEAKAEADEKGKQLLQDVYSVISKNGYTLAQQRKGRRSGDKAISTAELIEKLKEIDVAPWRKYKGRGLNADDVAGLFDVFPNLKAGVVRIGSGRENSKLLRGYLLSQVTEAASRAGVKLT